MREGEADDGPRTRDLWLGKPTLYQLSYVRAIRRMRQFSRRTCARASLVKASSADRSRPLGGASMSRRVRLGRTAIGMLAVIAVAVGTAAAAAVAQPDVRVSSGSPATPFSANKQNEPAVAIDQNHPNVLAAGSNDEIDFEACNAGPDNDCPFTPGVGVSGIYFSFDSGHTWTPAHLHRLERAQLPGSRLAMPTHPATPTRTARSARCRATTRPASSPTATRRSRSAPAPGERRLLLGERVAALLREPGVEASRPAPVQGRRGDRGRRAPTTSGRRGGRQAKAAWSCP